MLQSLRDKTSGWVATVILGLLIVPFAFFGVEEYFSRSQATYAARIMAPPTWWQSAPRFWPVSALWEKEEISPDDLRGQMDRVRQQEMQAMGDAFDAKAFENADNKRRILDGLIDQRIMRMRARQAGLQVSDALVRKTIAEIPAFQTGGKFDPRLYQMTLASSVPALTPRAFEQQIRDDLERTLLAKSLGDSAFATTKETDRMVRLLGERRDVALAVLPAVAPIPVTDEARIKAWYDGHATRYRAPESVTAEYIEITAAALPESTVDEAALRAEYDKNKATLGGGEQRLASHILIQVAKDADAATVKAAEAKAAQLAAQAKAAGADFAALAQANSQDVGSKAKGGDLGWMRQGAMPKPVDDALFAMQAGEVRGPVRSDFGFHVLKLREVKGQQQADFASMREQLAAQYLKDARERAFSELVGKVVDAVNKNPTTLAPAATLAGVTVQRLGPVARGVAIGIAGNPNVQRALFSETLIQDRTVSDAIEVEPGRSVLVRVLQHSPEAPLALAAAKAQVALDLAADDAAKAQRAKADAMLTALQRGTPIAQVAAGNGAQVQQLNDLQRGAPLPDQAANAAIFATRAAAAGKQAMGKLTLGDGRQAVFVVTGVRPGDPATVDPQSKVGLRRQITEMAGTLDVMDMVKAWRRSMRIDVQEDRF